jgi:hypothetical protein
MANEEKYAVTYAQCYGSGFTETGSGSSISTESGSGFLMTKNLKKNRAEIY